MLQLFIIEPQSRTAALLKTQKQVRVMGCATSTDAGAPVSESYDMILVSAALPRADVLEFLQQQRTNAAHSVVIDVPETESDIVPFLEAGAEGYVPQGANAARMVTILRGVAEGKPPFDPTVGTALVERMHELLVLQQQHVGETLRHNGSDPNSLTAREREILMLIRQGASNQTIANELMIELGTVKNHVHNILKKLNVTRRDQAASYVDLLEQTQA